MLLSLSEARFDSATRPEVVRSSEVTNPSRASFHKLKSLSLTTATFSRGMIGACVRVCVARRGAPFKVMTWHEGPSVT